MKVPPLPGPADAKRAELSREHRLSYDFGTRGLGHVWQYAEAFGPPTASDDEVIAGAVAFLRERHAHMTRVPPLDAGAIAAWDLRPPSRICWVEDCENEATITRTARVDRGPTRIEVTARLCESCAAEFDAGGHPQVSADFSR